MGVEILDNGTRVLTAPGATFGTDALLLARFAQPRRNERALDPVQRVRHRLTRLARRRAPRPLHRAGDRPRRVRPLRRGPGRKCRRRAHRAGLRRPAAALHRRAGAGAVRFCRLQPAVLHSRSPQPGPAPGRGPPHRQLHHRRRRGLRAPRPAGRRAVPALPAPRAVGGNSGRLTRPRALSRSVWLLSRTAPTPRPGFSSSKPRRAAKPACASSRTF